MAIRGQEAKQYIANKLKEVFGDDYLGEIGGKICVKAPEGGTKIQIAISMTCSKSLVSSEKDGGAFSLEDEKPKAKPVKQEVKKIERSEQENKNIQTMLRELGL